MQDFSRLVDPSFSFIGVRDSAASPGTAEYFNKTDNSVFGNPDALASFVQSNYKTPSVNSGNVFDFLKTPAASQAAPTATVSTPSGIDIYNQEYKNAGLTDVKSRLSDLDTAIAKIRDKYTHANGNINENPWLSEASRVGRGRILNDQMQSEIGNYETQQQQLQSLYNMGLDEVKLRLGLRQDDQNTAQATQQKALAFAAENKINSPFFKIGGTVYRTSDMTPFHSQQEAFAAGVSPDWSNVQPVQSAPELHTQVVTAGGRSVLIDTQTGTIIKDLGSAYKGTSGGSASPKDQVKSDIAQTNENLNSVIGPDGFVSPQDWKRAYSDWLAAGNPGDDFISYFKGYVNPADPQDYGVKL